MAVKTVIQTLLAVWFLFPASVSAASQTPRTAFQSTGGTVVMLDRSDQVVTTLVDGNQVRLRIELDQDAGQPLDFRFMLDTDEVASCSVPAGSDRCTTEPVYSLGWYWTPGGTANPQRVVKAFSAEVEYAALAIQVRPRPVVMVHGFASDWRAWENYLGTDGYLAREGIPGYAVGDGQVEGTMNTGSLDDPAGRTNTIQENAEIIGQYLANVRQATGAEMVDLLAHSMGGLISRYYIGQVMQERDVAQLIMLGSPMAGTECANLPAALGLYLPATLEIRPSYVVSIFNQQVTSRRGLAFYALAGDPITEAFKSPCTSVPTDIAVSQQSVTAIPLEARIMPVLHTELNTSEVVFGEFVLPLLQKGAGQYPDQPDQPSMQPNNSLLQFTRVFTGHLDPGQSQEIAIPIEEGVLVAGFSLFDTSRSLQTSVRGASGNVIELTAAANGLVVVKDPSSLFYLGYGFNNPKPGLWRVTFLTTEETPSEGADYALTAYMVGGAQLAASALPLLPQVGEQVTIEASLSLDGQPVDIQTAQARLRKPDGETVEIDLTVQGANASAAWQPDLEGLVGIDLLVSGSLPEGAVIERTAFLSIQVQPQTPPTRTTLFVIVLILAVIFLAMTITGFMILLRRRRQTSRT